tara:strand:+ start:1773 stop:1925 length:153 start_codon:yes stop_codon:yes gene_type:complete
MNEHLESIIEIDEALQHALLARRQTRDSKKHLIDKFIDDLLDTRLEASQC